MATLHVWHGILFAEALQKEHDGFMEHPFAVKTAIAINALLPSQI